MSWRSYKRSPETLGILTDFHSRLDILQQIKRMQEDQYLLTSMDLLYQEPIWLVNATQQKMLI
jgi:hypothetical protein